jgi:hypothetical protein
MTRCQSTVFAPFIGEFGFFIIDHIRFVHFYECPYKIVCCRPGEEMYFPSAKAYDYDWSCVVPDNQRSCFGPLDSAPFMRLIDRLTRRYHSSIRYGDFFFDMKKKFQLKPKVTRGLKVDVILAPRKRDLLPQHNYMHWDTIASTLVKHGYHIGCIGRGSTSQTISCSSVNSWDYDKADFESTAAIEMLQNCKLYIGTDTGASHLAAFLDVPSIVFSNWERSFVRIMQYANNKPIAIVEDGWDKPERIIEKAKDILGY